MNDFDNATTDGAAITELLRDGFDHMATGDTSALGHAVHRAIEGNLDDALASFSSRS